VSDEVTRQAAELRADRDAARAEVAIVIEERDAARAEVATLRIDAINWEQRTEALIRKADALVAERDAAQNETHELRRQYAKLHAEADGLRADLLAHPPEPHQELAIERKRHLELMEDYDRREVVITTLEEALKRTENALKVAQGQHIDERLKGFLAVISQLADQAQDLIP
jgi:hypothetical protein